MANVSIKNASVNKTVIKKKNVSILKTAIPKPNTIGPKYLKNNSTLITSLSQIQTNIRAIMAILAKYDKKSEQYLNSQFEKFEMYSKSIELDIEAQINENTTIFKTALDTVNEFVKEQKQLKQLDIEGNLNEHRQIKADLNIIKEEFTISIDQYKHLEKAVRDMKTQMDSELKDEELNVIKLVTELKADIKNIDNVLDTEMHNVEKSIADMLIIQKKEIDEKIKNNIEITKYSLNNAIEPLLTQIDNLSSKNNRLVHIIEQKEKEALAQKTNDVVSPKTKDYINDSIEPLLKQIDNLSSKNNRLVNLIEQKEKELCSTHNEKAQIIQHMTNIKTQLSDLNDNQKSNDSKMMSYLTALESEQNKKDDNTELINRLNALESEQNKKDDNTELINRLNALESGQNKKDDNIELITRLTALEDVQKTNSQLIKNALDTIAANDKSDSMNNIDDDLTTLLDTYKTRDAEREKRISNMLLRIEQAVETINKNAETSKVSETDELDSMISDLKKLQQESN